MSQSHAAPGNHTLQGKIQNWEFNITVSDGTVLACPSIINHIKEAFMVLRVQYHNDKFDYVTGFALAKLITTNEIKKFYRPSEERWVTVGIDAVRGTGGTYTGPDRRQSN